MTILTIQQKAIEIVVVFNAAVANIRLYPPTSDIIGASIGRLYNALQEIFTQESSIVFAESEKNLIISGQALNEKDQKRPQIISFLELIRNVGIKSITFEKGVDETQLLALLEIMSSKPDKIKNDGGLQQVVADKNLAHIHLDQKVYVAMDKDQQIVSSASVEADEPVASPLPEPEEISDIDRRTGKDRRHTESAEYFKKPS